MADESGCAMYRIPSATPSFYAGVTLQRELVTRDGGKSPALDDLRDDYATPCLPTKRWSKR